jgi:hypothetical protein
LKNIFEKNTPQYTLKIIKDMLMWSKNK